jgi:hypothetical protein
MMVRIAHQPNTVIRNEHAPEPPPKLPAGRKHRPGRRIFEHRDNLYTGERVPVFNFFNDRIRGELTPLMPQFKFGEEDDAPTLINDGTARVNADGLVPFILPWQRFGDRVLLSWDYTHRYLNPVTTDKWPKACTGEFTNPSEHFTFATSWDELIDRDKP